METDCIKCGCAGCGKPTVATLPFPIPAEWAARLEEFMRCDGCWEQFRLDTELTKRLLHYRECQRCFYVMRAGDSEDENCPCGSSDLQSWWPNRQWPCCMFDMLSLYERKRSEACIVIAACDFEGCLFSLQKKAIENGVVAKGKSPLTMKELENGDFRLLKRLSGFCIRLFGRSFKELLKRHYPSDEPDVWRKSDPADPPWKFYLNVVNLIHELRNDLVHRGRPTSSEPEVMRLTLWFVVMSHEVFRVLQNQYVAASRR